MSERISRQRSRRTRQRARRGRRPIVRWPMIGAALLGWAFSAALLAGPRVAPRALPAAGQRAPRTLAAEIDFVFTEPDVPGPGAAVDVRAGTTLVEAGERVTPQTHARLRAHHDWLRAEGEPGPPAARPAADAFLMGMALLLALAVWSRAAPDGPERVPRLALFLTLGLLGLGLVRLALHPVFARPGFASALTEPTLPLVLAPLLGGILAGPPLALAVGLWIAFGAAVLAGHSFPVLAMGLAVTGGALLVTQRVRRRSQVFQAGLGVGLVKALLVVALAVAAQPTGHVLALQAAAAVGSSLAAALLALLLLPLLEIVFGLTTDVRLLELSDPGHPLMQRLAMEAPGTYHHSLVMANLAHAAAERIGAHALLVRVCAYFHDIGKLTKPEFFTENAPRGHNPHDELSPEMSTLVITSHVKEGVGLAQHFKLPQPVLDGIRQHHGTSVVSFFLDRARRRNAGDAPDPAQVRADDFRYAGPKPASREMAILALADAIEAASRSLDKASPSRIENLVEEIVWQRIKDGQLDAADLTMRELTEVKRSFVFTLTNMLHGRVAYPRHEAGLLQPAAASAAAPSGAAAPDRPAARAGAAEPAATAVGGDRGAGRG